MVLHNTNTNLIDYTQNLSILDLGCCMIYKLAINSFEDGSMKAIFGVLANSKEKKNGAFKNGGTFKQHGSYQLTRLLSSK